MVFVAAHACTHDRRDAGPRRRATGERVGGLVPSAADRLLAAGGSDVTAIEEPIERPLTPEDVAALLRIDRETVYRMARRGELPAFKVSRRWRFLPSHLQRWMEQQEGRRT
jgi:excisionase family DNA binding protein